jgi:membrane associated rhomboid family serine protease
LEFPLFILPIEEDHPTRRFPWVNLSLIAANLYFFLATATRSDLQQVVYQYGFTPAQLEIGDVITSMFLHAGWGHLLGNMYFLFVFGDNVEDLLGKAKYLLAYSLSGVGAAAFQYALDPHSAIPMVGASGAISGVSALYMLMFPWKKFRLQFFFLIFPLFAIPTRAFFLVGAWAALQFLMAKASAPGLGGVAFWAHLGGFLAGLVLFFLLYRKPKTS